MNRFVMTIIAVLITVTLLPASEISINTPEGSITIQVSNPNLMTGSSANVGVLVENIGLKLEELEKNYISKLSRLDRTRADKLLEEIFALLALIPVDMSINIETNILEQVTIPKLIEEVEPATSVSIDSESPPAYTPMPDSDFRNLVSNVRNESFADNQINIIKVAVRTNRFTVNQIIQLLNTFSFGEDKLEALEILYPRVTDPENAYNIPNAFTYSEDKQQATEIISK